MYGNILTIIILSWYINHILRVLFSLKIRKNFQETNIRLNKLRCIAVKSIEEQKEFINLKYPKRSKEKFSWKRFLFSIPKVLLSIFIFIIIFQTISYVFFYFSINLKLWQGILFMILFPILINLILEKFNLQKNDLSIFFRGGK